MADGNATDDTKSAWNINRLTSDMRCSKVMGDQLAQLIKYCRLSGIDYKAVLMSTIQMACCRVRASVKERNVCLN